MTIILFILIFGAVVLSHEFGHFLLAKKNGIKVVEFCIGLGPTILHYDKNETRYSIKLFPIGGACIFDGAEEEHSTFLEASVWARIATTFAGPFFNLVLGFLISLIVVGYSGSDLPVINSVMENSAAQEAGMQDGDVITRINGQSIHLYREVSLHSALNRNGSPMKISFTHDGVEQNVILTPKYDEEDQRYYIGITGGASYIECKGFNVFKYGFYESQYIFRATIKSLEMLVTGKLSRNDVSGPVGIANAVGESYNEVKEYGIPAVVLTMLNYILILSINLGIMNLLPLPALDGGRLIFLLVELVRGKPVPPEKEGYVHLAGMILFLGLTIFVFYNDIMNIIH